MLIRFPPTERLAMPPCNGHKQNIAASGLRGSTIFRSVEDNQGVFCSAHFYDLVVSNTSLVLLALSNYWKTSSNKFSPGWNTSRTDIWLRNRNRYVHSYGLILHIKEAQTMLLKHVRSHFLFKH